MTFTPEQEELRASMCRHRRRAAGNLMRARALHQRGELQGTAFLEHYRHSSQTWKVIFPNPDRRAQLLKRATELENTLKALETRHPQSRAVATDQQDGQGDETVLMIQEAIRVTYALAEVAPY